MLIEIRHVLNRANAYLVSVLENWCIDWRQYDSFQNTWTPSRCCIWKWTAGLCDNAVKLWVCALFTASMESCCLQRLEPVGLILSSWITPFWVKHVHKFSRIKACLCIGWFLGEHMHIHESSPCKLSAQTKYEKYPILPSQLSGCSYDSTVPHLLSTAVDFLQFLPTYWVIKESGMLKLRGTWVTSSIASWPAQEF